MHDIYQKVSPIRVPEMVADQIKALITEGKLAPGTRLPPERKLSEFLSVGRSSLREAISTLRTLGFIESRNRRLYVRNMWAKTMPSMLSNLMEDENRVLDLYEIRRDIEARAVYVAAKVRTEENLKKIEKFLRRMGKDVQNSRPISLDDDSEFHMAIAEATHNLLRVHIFKIICDQYRKYWGFAINKIARDSTYHRVIVKHHEKIFDAIAEGNPRKAEAAMDEHITWVQKQFTSLRKSSE
jgi:GntR family transcriptional repressor for pyruvate dehydrogenase complex